MEQHNRFTIAFVNEMHVETIHMPVVWGKRVGITECFALDDSVFHCSIFTERVHLTRSGLPNEIR